MARVAAKRTPALSSSGKGRKRIPVDVRDEYKRLYGVSSEEWFNSGPVPPLLARAKHREWLTEIETRIENIRAGRNGGGQSLTPMKARALAGEWYNWFVARHLARNRTAGHWEICVSDYHDDFSAGVWDGSGEPWQEIDPVALWKENAKAKAGARPVVDDHRETAQFLHARGLTLEPSTREMFLDYVSQDLFEALGLLKLRAEGDYSEDPRPLQFPKLARTADPNLTPLALYKQWITEVKPADQTIDRWRCVFVKLEEDHPSAAAMTTDEAQVWTRGLINSERGARTVRVIWVAAARTIFEWAKGQRLVTHNPFTEVKVTVPKKIATRDKTFTLPEIKIILKAACAVSKPTTKAKAARRWVPWLCAYTGARGGEITQLRSADCIEQDGMAAIKITPEAGSLKTGQSRRVVPLHPHLIQQGFLEFVSSSGKGPLFYKEHKTPAVSNEITKPPKAPAVRTRESLAAWVRSLGVSDPEVQPNHAWRHTFKQIGRRAKIEEVVLDAITGHAPASVGQAYGEPSLKDKAEALKQFPRYSTGG
jgi:integrase